ncbi:MAG: NAD(P)H-hydrate epimerase, partial [Bacteroides sp.]|nr:NAD(P)H-hydrate epimerase [Bacteroides sp.]
MKIFKAEQVQDIDAYTIKNEPVLSEDLMERAALRLTGWYVRHYHIDQKVIIFAGPGNNGGDALTMARHLAERQYRVECYLLQFGTPSKDCALKMQRLLDQGLVSFLEIGEGDVLPEIGEFDVVVDGIFGSGLSRKVAGFPAQVIKHINQHPGTVFSVDIPSGLFGEDNSDNNYSSVIRATHTISFQFPFLSFFFRENDSYVGRWRVHDIKLHPHAIENTESPYQTIEKEHIHELLPRRNRFAHKGTFGHGLVISGCYGMMGAALLAGEACLRAGAGLTTVHVPRFGNNIIQTA